MLGSALSIAWAVLRPIWVLVLPYIGPVIEWSTHALGPLGVVLRHLSPALRIGILAAAVIVPLWLLSGLGRDRGPKLVPVSEVQLEAKEAELAAMRNAQAVAEETLRMREAQNASLERTLIDTKLRLEALRAQVPDADRPAIRADDQWMRID